LKYTSTGTDLTIYWYNFYHWYAQHTWRNNPEIHDFCSPPWRPQIMHM